MDIFCKLLCAPYNHLTIGLIKFIIIYLMLIFYLCFVTWLMPFAMAGHQQCLTPNFNPQGDASTTCFAEDPTTYVNDKLSFCYQQGQGLLQIPIHTALVHEPYPWSGLYTTFPWVQTTQSRLDNAPTDNYPINPLVSTFWCQGKAGVGCKDEPSVYPAWFVPPQPSDSKYHYQTYDVPTMTNILCHKDDLRIKYDQENVDNWKNEKYIGIDGDNKPLNNYFRECYCQFNADACSFKEYNTGKNIPGQVVVPTDEGGGVNIKNRGNYNTAYIEINTSTDRYRVLNITTFTKIGNGFSLLVEIAVCGGETIACIGGCPVISYQSMRNVADEVWSRATLRAFFLLTLPPTPANVYGWGGTKGYDCCDNGLTVGLFTNAAGTTPLVHPYIGLGTVVGFDGHIRIEVDRTVGFKKQVFWYVVQTLGGSQAVKKFDAEVCGAETITANVGDQSYGWFDLDKVGPFFNTPVLGNMGSLFSIDSTYCGIVSYEIVEDDGFGGYTPTEDFAYLTGQVSANNGTTTSALELKLGTPTPLTGVTRYIKATSIYGQFAVIKFVHRVCGIENIQTTMTPPPPFYNYYYGVENTGSPGLFRARNSIGDFTNDNQVNCPIVEWSIQQETAIGSGVFTNFSNYQQTGVDTYSDTNAVHYHNTLSPNAGNDYPELWFVAWSLAGQLARYPFRLKVCGLESLIDNNPPWYFVFDKNSIPTTQTIDISGFRTSDDPLCPVYQWSLHVLVAPSTYVPYVNDFSTDYHTNPYSIKVNTINPHYQTLYVKSQSVTNYVKGNATADKTINEFDKVFIKVCGLESVTTTLGYIPYYFNYYNTGDHDETLNLMSWFANNDTIDCPIIAYEVFEDRWNTYTDDFVEIHNPNPLRLEISTKHNIRRSYWIKARTKANVWVSQEIDVHVCGQERIDLLLELRRLVFQHKEGWPSILLDWLDPLMWSTDETICPITNFEMVTQDSQGNYVPITSPMIKVDNVLRKMDITTENHGFITFYVKATTLGNVINYLPVELEICGGEKISIKPGSQILIEKYYWIESGQRNIQTIKSSEFMGLLQVGSSNCPIDGNLTDLYWLNPDTNNFELYTVGNIWFNKTTQNIYTNTTETFRMRVYIGLRTLSSTTFYFPLQIEVQAAQDLVFNRPPTFFTPNGYVLNYTINEANNTYRFPFNITEQFDDHDKLATMNFSAPRFGRINWKYTVGGQEPYRVDSKNEDFLSFDPATNVLYLDIPGGPNMKNILGLAGGIYSIDVIISDEQGLTAAKKYYLNLTLDDEWYEEYKEKLDNPYVDELQLIRQPVGRIDHISVFGEVDINLNKTSQFRAKNFTREQLKTIYTNHIKLYIVPAHEWQGWRNQDTNTLNFTWELREFNEQKIRIKLTFPNASAVSPFPQYDKLRLFIPDLIPLFNNFADEDFGRRLVHTDHQAQIEKGIQKQMYDTQFGRETVHVIYSVRWFLVVLLIFTMILAVLFRTPLDRVYLMMLELQLMCNFAIFYVPLPGNVEISSQIMKQLVSLNMMKDITYYNFGKEESVIKSEEQLEFLGQRATYNYNTFNLMFNMETLGIIFFLYLIKIFIISALWCFNKYCKSPKADKYKKHTQKYHTILLDQAIYDDLLNLFLRFFLEFGIAAFVVFQTPIDNLDLTGANLLMTIAALSGIFIGVPFVYYFIYQETMIQNLTAKNFKTRFGYSLLGARIDLNSRSRRKYFFYHVLCFILLRLAFVIIAFMTTYGWVQIGLLLLMFFANTCRVTYMRPMFGRWNNFLAIFNQMALTMCVYHLICFTDWLERDDQYLCGFSFLVTVGVFIIVNLLYILMDLTLYVKYILLCYWPNAFVYCNMLMDLSLGFLRAIKDFFLKILAFFQWLWQTIIFYTMYAWLWMTSCFRPKLRTGNMNLDVTPSNIPRPIMMELEEDNTAVPTAILAPPPPEPEVMKLQLIKGVWTQVAVKLSQMDKVQGRDFLKNETPTFNSIAKKVNPNFDRLVKQPGAEMKPKPKLVTKFGFRRPGEAPTEDKVEPAQQFNFPKAIFTKQDDSVTKKKSKKPKKDKTPIAEAPLARRWSLLNADLQAQDESPSRALFHDPSLFFRDQDKDRSKDAMKQVIRKDNAGISENAIIEKNPMTDQNKRGWGNLVTSLGIVEEEKTQKRTKFKRRLQ